MALIIAMIGTQQTNAQDYNAAIGVRLGVDMTGVDFKYNLGQAHTIEAIVDFAKGFNVVGLYEHNTQIASSFKCYYGLGAGIGTWTNSELTVGIHAIVGVEYAIPTVPFAISLDYKPFFNVSGQSNFFAKDFGLGIKYTF